jgi:hypothetical protein
MKTDSSRCADMRVWLDEKGPTINRYLAETNKSPKPFI